MGNRADTEGQILHDSTYVSTGGGQGPGQGEMRRWYSKGTKFQL
jgi:hypothetical protein